MSGPICRTCGEAIKKRTTYFLFQNPREAREARPSGHAMGRDYGFEPAQDAKLENEREETYPYSWVIYVPEERRPTNKAECARFSNHPIVSIQRDYHGRVSSFTVWDGESYQDDLFCTNRCAETFGRVYAGAGYTLAKKVPKA